MEHVISLILKPEALKLSAHVIKEKVTVKVLTLLVLITAPKNFNSNL